MIHIDIVINSDYCLRTELDNGKVQCGLTAEQSEFVVVAISYVTTFPSSEHYI